MLNPPSAEIIPFPASRLPRPVYAPAAAFPASDRLSTALDSLSAALAEQHRAIQRWRAALAELSASMRSLSSALPPPHPTETHAS